MSAAFYIVVDSHKPGFDISVNGKALSRASDALDAAAEKAGVATLMSFFSMSDVDVEAVTEEFEIPGEIERALTPEVWFDPDAGLNTVRALLKLMDGDPNALGQGVHEDLLQFERVLREAKQRGLRWHLGIDY